MSRLDYLYTGLLGAVVGIYIGGQAVKSDAKPKSAYMRDVNGDGVNDIVTEDRLRHREVLLGQKDGTFRRLDTVSTAQKESIDTRVREIETKTK